MRYSFGLVFKSFWVADFHHADYLVACSCTGTTTTLLTRTAPGFPGDFPEDPDVEFEVFKPIGASGGGGNGPPPEDRSAVFWFLLGAVAATAFWWSCPKQRRTQSDS